MTDADDPTFAADDPLFLAGVDMLRRTGARDFQIRFSDDLKPVVWIAVVEHWIRDGMPVATGGEQHFETGAGLSPRQAILRLLDQVVDGGQCRHCGRPTGVTEAWADDMPMAHVVCWYAFDPELRTFRRGCE